ncbi:MAG: ribose 5-phosphate isomerase B [Bacteroidales bacterium]|nr:ribose 5-phosphate isomerase B [Bacteroidales bacterium]MBN2821541.1 ribose 5-phosphate isomerase B [Bacteroidales bacterium]
MKIAIASDHAGYDLKIELIKYLENKGYSIKDFGSFSSESSDYADFAHPLAEAVENGEFPFGISLCGSGNGINITVNKHQGIRSALCWIPEIAELARQHNNANILALPARFITYDNAVKMVDIFLTTEFEGGRHERRINKIPCK